jgi:autotransporter-associated beta strand protein
MAFDGQTAGPVSATSNTGVQTGSSVGGTTAGLYLHLMANQTNPVTFHTTVANSASSGIRFNSITIDAGAGTFNFGKGSTTNALDTIWGTSNPQSHGFTNNSANPAIINSDVRFRLGAGGAHTFIFAGTGDWYVTNDLANFGGAATLITKAGPGTMYWTAGHNAYWGTVTVIASPMTIADGTLVLKSGGLIPAMSKINNNGTALVYDAPASSQAGGAQTINDAINGTGSLRVNNGTLTLGGSNTFTGNITLSGGELVVNHAENLGVNGPLGNGGFISFTGGTLGFSVNNTYDYSPRFTNAPGQAISIDTAGLNVTFTSALTSSGGSLTKLGAGTLTLSGQGAYTGRTFVNGGALIINSGNLAYYTTVLDGTLGGNGTLSGPVTLNAGTTFAPGASAGSVGTLTINNSLTNGGNLAIEVNKSLSPSNDLVVVSGLLINTGTGTLTVSNLGPAVAVGDKFTLFSKPMQNGAAVIVSGARANWINNLAVDGSITVGSLIPSPTLNFTRTGNSLQFTWTDSFNSFKLQSQTNSLASGLGANWADYPGGGTSPVTVTIGMTNGAVFFRLLSTP